jgi:hypothetical protein
LPYLQKSIGGRFAALPGCSWKVFDRAAPWFAAQGLTGPLQSMDFIGLLDVRVLEVLDVFLKNGCWMFLKAPWSSIRMRSKCCASGC